MTNIKSWIQAFRLRTLPLSFSCIGMGAFLAASQGYFDFYVLTLCLLTTLFLQILSNLANDYGDSKHGADNTERSGPGRAVQLGLITANGMKRAVYLFSTLSLISGAVLLIYVFSENLKILLLFFAIGVLCILGAIYYTNGKRPYGYVGLGDVSVFIFFGIVGVLGTFFLFTKFISWAEILPATTCGFFSVSVLNINNIRDIESDRIAGKISIPVRIGRKKAVIYHWALLFLGVLSSVIYGILRFERYWQFSFLVMIFPLVKNGISIASNKEGFLLDPLLKQMAITTLLFVILFGVGLLF